MRVSEQVVEVKVVAEQEENDFQQFVVPFLGVFPLLVGGVQTIEDVDVVAIWTGS